MERDPRQLQARAAEARATAQRRHQEAKSRGAEVKDKLASTWASLRYEVHEEFEKMHAKLGERRDDHDVKVAERRAESAAGYAADAVDFASDAIAEAEAAVLEAADARAIADAKAGSQVAR